MVDFNIKTNNINLILKKNTWVANALRQSTRKITWPHNRKISSRIVTNSVLKYRPTGSMASHRVQMMGIRRLIVIENVSRKNTKDASVQSILKLRSSLS